MPGAGSHPQPRMGKQKPHELATARTTGNHPAFPHANGFNSLYRALPGDRAFLPPSPARCESIVANLTSASRCQDHTTSPSASSCARLAPPKRPPHPAPNVRDDRETPLWKRRDGIGSIAASTNVKSGKFFERGVDSKPNQIRLNRLGNLFFGADARSEAW